MIVNCVSDLHNHTPDIDTDTPLIIAGDLSFFKKRDILSEIEYYEDALFPYLSQFKSVLMIAGNHDFAWEYLSEKLKSQLPDNVTYICNEVVEWNGLKVGGTPYTLEYYDWAFQATEEDLHSIFSSFGKCDIVVSHGPPYGVLDFHGNHIGSYAARDYIQQYSPQAFICGHIHQYGTEMLNSTLVVNASYVKDDYQWNGYEPIQITLRELQT